MIRADVLLTLFGHCPSRTLAAQLIKEGRVKVGGQTVKKPSQPVDEFQPVEILSSPLTRYVGRGGLKLEAALDAFSLNVQGQVCLDVGASTGGFTDCLLQHGARQVISVDVGTAQLHPKLRFDKRVVCRENTNARNLDLATLPKDLSVVVMDVSFTSQAPFYPMIARVLPPDGFGVLLIKPQFEVGRAQVGKNGIVKNQSAVRTVLDTLALTLQAHGLERRGLIPCPITGGDGNQEYLQLITPQKNGGVTP